MDGLGYGLLWALVGYLFGSFPTGYVAAKALKGIDIRTFGSGNTGGTNAGRLLGRKWAIAVTAVDMLKGGLAVCLCLLCRGSETQSALTALASVLGHNYPIWLQFRGGKGVATTLGTLFFLHLWPSAAAVISAGAVWFLVTYTSRYVSVGSLAALLSLWFFLPFWGAPLIFRYLALALFLLATWRHRGNLWRIVEGTEDKIGQNQD